jgi:predicted NBD/HSP70 family sugar kinase
MRRDQDVPLSSDNMSNASPFQPKLLSKINERLVLKMIQEKGPSTCSEMSKYIGVTFPTITKAVSSLLDSRLLEEEICNAPQRPGRPAKRLRLACTHSQVIGVTLGEDECTIVCGDLNGIIHEETMIRFLTPTTYDSLLIEIASGLKHLMRRNRKTTFGVGVSVPAVIDYQTQTVIFSANLPLINGRSIGKDIQSLLKQKQDCVVVRDSHALSLSERLYGEAKQISNFAMLDHCRGIGLGLMVDGRFLTGNYGFAGELGHIQIVPDGDMCVCGKKGCLESVASEWAVEKRMSGLLRRPVHINEVLELAQSGDKQSRRELERMCDYLAIGLSHVVNILNPGTFFIYGRVFAACPELFDLLIKKTSKIALGPSFSSCEFLLSSCSLQVGTIATVINCLIDSLVPNLDGYLTH